MLNLSRLKEIAKNVTALTLILFGTAAFIYIYGILPTQSPEVTKVLSQQVPAQAPQSVPVPKSREGYLPNVEGNSATQKVASKYKTIELHKANTLLFRGTVTDESVSAAISSAIKLSSKLKPTDVIYLVIDSPGGSISAGNELIDALNGLPNKVDTITIFSASMAAFTVEKLGKRYITPSGTIMFHQASIGGVSGNVPEQALNRLKHILYEVGQLEQSAAERIGVSDETYRAAIHDELWLSGDESVAAGTTDEVVYLRCGADLNETYTLSFSSLFGNVSASFSTCPLITQPLSQTEDSKFPPELRKYLELLFKDKKEFVRRYIVNGDYVKFERQ